MTDDLVKQAQEAVGRAFSTRGRPRGGAGGQTIDATMRSTFHEISAYDLDIITEALATLQAERDAAVLAEREEIIDLIDAHFIGGLIEQIKDAIRARSNKEPGQ